MKAEVAVPPYTLDHIVLDEAKGRFYTTDGLYHTREDADGYSYWFETRTGRCIYSSVSYDYCFATPNGILGALRILNKLLDTTP